MSSLHIYSWVFLKRSWVNSQPQIINERFRPLYCKLILFEIFKTFRACCHVPSSVVDCDLRLTVQSTLFILQLDEVTYGQTGSVSTSLSTTSATLAILQVFSNPYLCYNFIASLFTIKCRKPNRCVSDVVSTYIGCTSQFRLFSFLSDLTLTLTTVA